MINVRGVSSKPLSDLAERLNLTRAALYYYVKDREDLVFQVYRRTCEILGHCLARALDDEADAVRVVQRFVALVLDPDAPDVSVLGEIGLLRPQDREALLGHYEQIVARLAEVLSEGQKRGEVRPCDTVIAARTIISIVISIPANSNWAMLIQGPKIGDRRLQIALAQDMLAEGWLADRSQVIDPPPIDLSPLVPPRVAPFDREALTEARREAILVAASGIINRKGVDSTSMDEVAAAVGATKRTLYQLIGDKNELNMACATRAGRIMFHVFMTAFRDMEKTGLTPDLVIRWQRGVATVQLRKDIEPVRSPSGVGTVDPAKHDQVREIILRGNEARMQLVGGLQESGQMRTFGELSRIGPPNIWWNSMNWLSRGDVDVDDVERPRLAAEVVEVLSLGLRSL